MATNPILERATRPVKRSLQESVDYGNSLLMSLGRNDVHWYVHDGQLCIGWRGRPGQ